MSTEASFPTLNTTQTAAPRGVNWKQVITFLALTFGLTWALDLALYLSGGLTHKAAGLILQFQMMLPAFSALLLGVFFFKDSPVYRGVNRIASRWFIYYYFLLTLLYLVGAVAGLVKPEVGPQISQILLIPNLIGLILLVVLRLVVGKEAFAGAGMAGGKVGWWLLLGLGVILYYALQGGLNYLFKLGTPADITRLMPQAAASSVPGWVLLLSAGFNAIIIGPLLGLIITFGEEYGWRGYLQSELIRMGRARGVLLLGVIWGMWHWPVIWMGYNYPGQPILGSVMMVAYCIILAYFLAYAVFKSKGVWTAAFLHALNNQVWSFIVVALVTPSSVLFSFGMGLPGIAVGALVVLLLLRDPVWKEPVA